MILEAMTSFIEKTKWLHRPFSYSTKVPGLRVVFKNLYAILYTRLDRVAIELGHYCAHSKIPQSVEKYRWILILFRIAERSIINILNMLIPHSD